MAGERVTTAAGGIVWRRSPQSGRKLEVLVIHRPRYDDWTFPKGKSEPGETIRSTAVREIAEETGLRVRLGRPLSPTRYQVSSGTKVVSYWVARLQGADHDDVVPNREVDELRWLRVSDARSLLTYQHDVELLDEFDALRRGNGHKTRTLVVLRHGKATARASWRGPDDERPLVRAGLARAKELVPELAAYGVSRVVSSPALRCTQTLDPYANSLATFLRLDDRLSEGSSRDAVERAVASLTDRKRPAVLCSHRPTLPYVFDALGLPTPSLAPGEAVVVHHRRGRVVATEPLVLPVS
ncbi:MAG: NUDIX hydrolase [Aeromicrobium erythreum]